MADIGWLFGWAKQNGIDIPLNADGTATIPKLFELYDEWRERNGDPKEAKSFPKPPKAYSFNRLNTKHHKDHAKEMGFKNTKEYEAAAVEFFNSDRGVLYYSNKSKKYYRYEEKTELFAVSSENVVHTFMKRTKKQFERKILQEELKIL